MSEVVRESHRISQLECEFGSEGRHRSSATLHWRLVGFASTSG